MAARQNGQAQTIEHSANRIEQQERRLTAQEMTITEQASRIEKQAKTIKGQKEAMMEQKRQMEQGIKAMEASSKKLSEEGKKIFELETLLKAQKIELEAAQEELRKERGMKKRVAKQARKLQELCAITQERADGENDSQTSDTASEGEQEAKPAKAAQKKYPCLQCDKTYLKRSSVKRHQREKHAAPV